MKKVYASFGARKFGFFIALMSFALLTGAGSITPPEIPQTKSNGEAHFQEEFQAPLDIPGCNQNVVWHSSMRAETHDIAAEIQDLYSAQVPNLEIPGKEDFLKKLEKILSKRLIRNLLIEGKSINLGAFRIKGYYWTDENGKKQPLVAYRSGITPWPKRPNSCYRSLLTNGHIKKIINLYDGSVPIKDHLTMEMEVAQEMGINYIDATDPQHGFPHFRSLVEKEVDYNDPVKRKEAMDGVARLIMDGILRPDGEAPKGNVYYHCAGGMHRTGIVSGVIQRCVNGMDMETIQKSYAHHVAYENEEIKGGFEELNLRFIKEFDCGLLNLEPKQNK